MKKTSLTLALATGLLLAFGAARLLASDASTETTLTGTMVCAKCKLHEADKCQNVLQVEKDGKTVNYYLTQNKVSKDFHSNICQNDGEKVTVTGTVKEKGEKEMLVASKIEAAK
ncbi:MAG TPA: DUF6370 family protein [Candidatus Limnocylindrales bacterium]|nr:DUF6370 family protein [Candidatus Limnocylindrales bacterium]